jgi:hypothetical protein
MSSQHIKQRIPLLKNFLLSSGFLLRTFDLLRIPTCIYLWHLWCSKNLLAEITDLSLEVTLGVFIAIHFNHLRPLMSLSQYLNNTYYIGDIIINLKFKRKHQGVYPNSSFNFWLVYQMNSAKRSFNQVLSVNTGLRDQSYMLDLISSQLDPYMAVF